MANLAEIGINENLLTSREVHERRNNEPRVEVLGTMSELAQLKRVVTDYPGRPSLAM